MRNRLPQQAGWVITKNSLGVVNVLPGSFCWLADKNARGKNTGGGDGS